MKKSMQPVVAEQPRNPAKLLFEAVNLPASKADSWFESIAVAWSTHSGQGIETTRGVLSRWLYFFALMEGGSDVVKDRFGRHLNTA